MEIECNYIWINLSIYIVSFFFCYMLCCNTDDGQYNNKQTRIAVINIYTYSNSKLIHAW